MSFHTIRMFPVAMLAALATTLALALTAGAHAEECSVPAQHNGSNVRTDEFRGIGRYIVNPDPATGCSISCRYAKRDEAICPVTTTPTGYDNPVRGYLQFSAPHFNCECPLPGGATRFYEGSGVFYRCGAQNDMWRTQGYRVTMNLQAGQIDLDTNHTQYQCLYDWDRR